MSDSAVAGIRSLTSLGEREIRGLSEVLMDCVEGGAPLDIRVPLSRRKAQAYWRDLAPSVARGERVVLAYEDGDGAIVGTAQVVLEYPKNDPQRADLARIFVRRLARRQGIGSALLAAAEREALRAGKTLLVLDTASGDLERLCARAGWQHGAAISAQWSDDVGAYESPITCKVLDAGPG